MALSPWMVSLARQDPSILFGPAYWSISPPNQPAEKEASAVPIGFADDASYLGGVKARLVRAAMISPGDFTAATSLDEFRFRTLLCLLRQRDLRLISIWHPSFLTLLLDALPNHWNEIVKQISLGNASRACELEHVIFIKLTQEQLAEKTGVSARYVQSLEAGEYFSSQPKLVKLKLVLRCDWAEIFDGCEKV